MQQATNLYELCEQVAEAIENSPLNYYQEAWACDARERYGAEACGTAFCRAGWMMALASPKKHTTEYWLERNTWGGEIMKKATEMFARAGISSANIDELFSNNFSRSRYNYGMRRFRPGSEDYAKVGAAGMREFMSEFEKVLKATPVVDKAK